jgi:hypothetical protein
MAFLEYRPTQTLYQFTSVEGFRGMISSKEIWCTDLAEANDPRELALGNQHFLEALKFVRKHEYKSDMGIFLDTIEQNVLECRERQQTFCACFSMVKDELPMWREYGSNYAGLAVGFRPTAITSMPGRIQKVKYLNPETAEEFRQLVREVASKFDRQHNASDDVYWIEAGTSIFSAMTALKHHSWAYEKEVRFVHVQVRKEPPAGAFRQIAEFSDKTPVFWTRPLRHARQNGSVDYRSFLFGRRKDGRSDPSGAIERVVLGPRCLLTEADVTDLLRTNGFERFDIEKSDCQIR